MPLYAPRDRECGCQGGGACDSCHPQVQPNRSRSGVCGCVSGTAEAGTTVDMDVNAIGDLEGKNVPHTVDDAKYDYTGGADGAYTFGEHTGKVLAIRTVDGWTDIAADGTQYRGWSVLGVFHMSYVMRV